MKYDDGCADAIMYFDTKCGFCGASISRFLETSRARIIVKSIFSDEARTLCELVGAKPNDTILLITIDGFFLKTAAYAELCRLCGFDKSALLLRVAPRALCNAVYSVVGRVRQRLSKCLISPVDLCPLELEEHALMRNLKPMSIIDEVMSIVGASDRAIGRRLDSTLIFEEVCAPGGNEAPLKTDERWFGLPYKVGLALARMKGVGARH